MKVYIYPQILAPMFWERRYYKEKKKKKITKDFHVT